jgi:ribosomal protein S18
LKNLQITFFEINSANKDKDISMLKYLRQTIYWKSILATAKQVDYPNYKELKSFITKYFIKVG